MSQFLLKYFGNEEAFGLPKGTVRGLVFLMLTSTICLLALHAKEIPAQFLAIYTGVVGFYFGQAISNGKPKEELPKP